MAKLTEADAAVIKGMLARGDKQWDVAVWFGVNAARIAEINTRQTFRDVPASHGDLPERGPYVTVSKIVHDELALRAAVTDGVIAELKAIISKLTNSKARTNDQSSIDSQIPIVHCRPSGGTLRNGQADEETHWSG